MENNERNRLEAIVQGKIENPIPLSLEVLQRNGFGCVWGVPGSYMWASDSEPSIVLNEEKGQFIYEYGYPKRHKVILQYEHQLQGLLAYYSPVTAE